MRKKLFLKVTALVVCLGFISLYAPGLIGAEKKAQKFDVKVLVKKPWVLFTSIVPIFNSIFDHGRNDSSKNGSNGNSGAIVRPTGDSVSPKPGGGGGD